MNKRDWVDSSSSTEIKIRKRIYKIAMNSDYIIVHRKLTVTDNRLTNKKVTLGLMIIIRILGAKLEIILGVHICIYLPYCSLS